MGLNVDNEQNLAEQGVALGYDAEVVAYFEKRDPGFLRTIWGTSEEKIVKILQGDVNMSELVDWFAQEPTRSDLIRPNYTAILLMQDFLRAKATQKSE